MKINYYIPGMILILMALVILSVPKILVFVMASSLIVLGICVLYIGHLMKRKVERYDGFSYTVLDDGFTRDSFHRESHYWN